MMIDFYKGSNDTVQANSSHLRPGTIWYIWFKKKKTLSVGISFFLPFFWLFCHADACLDYVYFELN